MIGVKNIMNEADKKTNPEILVSLRKAAELMAKKKRDDFWTSDEGQAELPRMITARAKPPEQQYKKSLFGLDYTVESRPCYARQAQCHRKKSSGLRSR